MFLLYHAYVYLEFLILACTIYILAPEIVFYDGNIEVKLLYDDFLKELLKVAEEREVSSNG